MIHSRDLTNAAGILVLSNTLSKSVVKQELFAKKVYSLLEKMIHFNYYKRIRERVIHIIRECAY